jgi:hypothetical protein
MPRTRIVLTCLALAAALVARPAVAADQKVFGKIVLVKNNLDPAKRKVKYLAKEAASASTIVGNPTVDGATFEIVMEPELGTGSQQCFVLPGAGWSAIGAIGYKYKDVTGTYGPIKVATIKRSPSGTFILKVVANGTLGAITLQPPARTAQADVFFRVAGGDRYCSVFGGDFLADAVSGFKAKNAPAPSSCAGAFLVCSPSGAFLDESCAR